MSTPGSMIVYLIDLVKDKKFQEATKCYKQAEDEYFKVLHKINTAEVKKLECIQDLIKNVSNNTQQDISTDLLNARKIIDIFFQEEHRASLKQNKTGVYAIETNIQYGDRHQDLPAPAPEPISERGNQAIATAFRDLYDNEWMHAFEELPTRIEEKEIAQILLEIVQNPPKTMKPTVCDVELLERYIYENAHLALPRLLHGFRNILIDFVQKWSKHLKKKYEITFSVNDGMKKYINQCVQVTYLLYLEDPPIRMEYGNPKKQLDETRYDPYTRRGNSIDYIVWPALVNGSGELLMKGKAQCK